jgi:chemotaxis regulatin CheY-phosphate phosphatase CheZ
MRLLVDKRQLLADTVHLQGLLEEYCAFLPTIAPGTDWVTAAQQMLRRHGRYLDQARLSLQTLEIAAALIRHILSLRPGEYFAIPMSAPERAVGARREGEPGQSWIGTEETRHVIARINGLAKHAPIAIQERLRFLLNGLLRFLEALPGQDPAALDGALSEINLLTSNREGRRLVREIARMAREVYESLGAMSDTLPLELLTESSQGISEAVRRVRSVIGRLEQAASENLDRLEAVVESQSAESQRLAVALQDARRLQRGLAEVKRRYPQHTTALDRILETLGNEVASTTMHLSVRYSQQDATLLRLISNQSFQDLTGVTLQKIVAFIESLQMQLLSILERYQAVLSVAESELAARPAPPAPSRSGESSQDEVDSLLAKFGF